MKDEMENQQTREMKRENPTLKFVPHHTPYTRERQAQEVNAAPQLWPEVF